jgi:hypothetical protein
MVQTTEWRIRPSAGELGEGVYTKFNEPEYPEVLAINTGRGVLPWWVVLGVEVDFN